MDTYQQGLEFIQDLITKRWVPEILYSISMGNHTFTSILNSIEFLSQTELQRKLKLLEEYQCVHKDEELVEYYMTEYGEEVHHLFQHVFDLGQRLLVREAHK